MVVELLYTRDDLTVLAKELDIRADMIYRWIGYSKLWSIWVPASRNRVTKRCNKNKKR